VFFFFYRKNIKQKYKANVNFNYYINYILIVEDPNEKFSDMRDIIDLRLLFATDIFKNIEAPIPPNHPVLLKIQNEYKFSKVLFFNYNY